MKRRVLTFAVLFLIASSLMAGPKRPDLELVEIEWADGVHPRGINNAGEVSGWLRTGNSRLGFVTKEGQTTLISAPGSTETFAWGIDDQGRVPRWLFS